MTHPSEELLPASDEANRAQRELLGRRGASAVPGVRRHQRGTVRAVRSGDARRCTIAARRAGARRGLRLRHVDDSRRRERVAPAGRVVGVDISAAMLEPARQRLAAAGPDNVELLHADAQVHPFEPGPSTS